MSVSVNMIHHKEDPHSGRGMFMGMCVCRRWAAEGQGHSHNPQSLLEDNTLQYELLWSK